MQAQEVHLRLRLQVMLLLATAWVTHGNLNLGRSCKERPDIWGMKILAAIEVCISVFDCQRGRSWRIQVAFCKGHKDGKDKGAFRALLLLATAITAVAHATLDRIQMNWHW